MTPITRIEQLINAIVESEASPFSAVTRIESYLTDILNNTTSTLVPVTRVEMYLAKISGADVAIPAPVTRIEMYLAAIAGEDIETPIPVTRLEYFLADWAAGAASLETVTGNAPVTLLNAVARAIVSLTQTGLCTQADTPTLADPVDIYCNNGKLTAVDGEVVVVGSPEVLTVSGPNLLNTATNITGKYINAGGGIYNGDDAQYTDLIPVKAGETYVASFVNGRDRGNNRWHGYDANGGWVKQLAYVNVSEADQGAKLAMTATIDSGISYVRLSYGITDTEAMLEKGSVATDYQPYVAPQTATAENLYSVGDTKDEQDIISGHVTRRCAACVYDGTQPVGDSYISTTGGKDVGAIIVYTLESPVAETVTAQPLTTAEGTNNVSVTAEVSPIALEVEYYAKSA